jgi:hypothetical protein
MAIFTTMAVLGGGEQDPPRWLIGIEGEWQALEEEPAALPAPGETTDGTGTDVHEELEAEMEDSKEGEDESFLFGDLAEQLDSLSDD